MSYAIESKRFGLKKEAVRLTAEAAPDTWIAVEPDSEFDYKLNHIADTALRGIKAPYPNFPGTKECSGTVKLPARASDIGELFQMLLGNPTTAQQGVTTAYKHTFPTLAPLQPPTYTWFVDRGVGIKKYSGVAAKKLSFTGPIDGALNLEAELLGISEADGAIGAPVFAESDVLEFFHTTMKIDGVARTDVKSWNCSIDNTLFTKRTLSQSQDAQDVMAPSKMIAEGGFLVFFESMAERDKFLANTTSSLEFLVEGAVADAPHKFTMDLLFPKVHYTAFPFGETDNLLAAQATFTAVYDTVTAKMLEAYLINLKTAY